MRTTFVFTFPILLSVNAKSWYKFVFSSSFHSEISKNSNINDDSLQSSVCQKIIFGLASITLSVCILKSHNNFMLSFAKTASALWLYSFLVILNPYSAHNSQCMSDATWLIIFSIHVVLRTLPLTLTHILQSL